MKRTPLSLFRTQRRGGKGISGISVSERDYVEHLFVASTHTYILIFTDIGKVYWLKVHQIPEAGRSAKGRPIVNLLPLQGGENVTTVLPVRDFSQEAYIVMATKKGYVKKTHLGAFSHPRSTGIIAINLEEDDSLMAAVLTNEGDMLFFASREGMCLMISSEEVREMGRTARGVRGIRLRGDDSLISMINVQNDDTILSITDKGYGKRTPVDRYRLQRRGGIGVINMKLNERNGKMVRAFQVSDNDEIILMTTKGTMIRIPASEIKVVGRNAMGVKLMNVNEDEWVVSAQKVMDIE
jgi:DNA gyrase subunit A